MSNWHYWMGALHGAPVCELRGGSSTSISQPKSWQGQENSEAVDDSAASLMVQVPHSDDNEQPPPEGAKKHSIRHKIMTVIRKPLDKLRRSTRVLRDPPYSQNVPPIPDVPPLPRRESKRHQIKRANKKLAQITDEDIHGSQSGACETNLSVADSSQFSSQSKSDGAELTPHTVPEQCVWPVLSSDDLGRPIQDRLHRGLQVPHQKSPAPLEFTHELATSLFLQSQARGPLSAKEAEKAAKYRAIAVRRDKIEQAVREYEREQMIRSRERRRARKIALRRARRIAREFIRRRFNRFRKHFSSMGGDGEAEGGEGGQDAKRRPRLLRRLIHRRRDQNPKPVRRVSLNEREAFQCERRWQFRKLTMDILSGAAQAAFAWAGSSS